MGSSDRYNPPRWHLMLIFWTLLCVGGAALGIGIMVAYPLGTSGWQGGGFLALMCAAAYVGTAAWWLNGQRVIEIRGDRLTIRSWLGAVRRSPGIRLGIGELSEAALVFDSGKKLRLLGPRFRCSFWVGMWPREDLDRLIATLGQMGVGTRREW